MSDLLLGRALVWASYDPTGILTISIRTILAELMGDAPVRLRRASVQSPGEIAECSSTLGFAIWKLSQPDELRPICEALVNVRSKADSPICVVFHDPELSDCTAILAESGAQIVTSQLTSLQVALYHAVPRAPLSKQGYHPLTSGIVERLPWPES